MTPNAFLRACHCDPERAAAMLQADPGLLDARGPDGETPMGAAAHSDQPGIVQLLLGHGVSLTLDGAIVMGYLDTVGRLLDGDHGLARSRSRDAHNFPPLYFAAISGHEAVADLLLSHGALVGAADDRDLTPLHGAAQQGRLNMVGWLLAHGADVNAWSAFGGTPLHLAAYEGRTETVRLLLGNGADRHARTRDGQTPLDLALERGHTALASLLR